MEWRSRDENSRQRVHALVWVHFSSPPGHQTGNESQATVERGQEGSGLQGTVSCRSPGTRPTRRQKQEDLHGWTLRVLGQGGGNMEWERGSSPMQKCSFPIRELTPGRWCDSGQDVCWKLPESVGIERSATPAMAGRGRKDQEWEK